MRTSLFHIREQLTGLLLELPAVTSGIEDKEPQAVQRLIDLLRRAEQLLIDNRMRQAADTAAIRAGLAAARLTDGLRSRQKERRLALEKVAAVGAALTEALAPLEQRIDSARLPARQLLQLVAASGAVRLDGDGEPVQLAKRIWQLSTEHDQLKPLAMQIRVALQRQDIPLLLSEEIDLADFTG